MILRILLICSSSILVSTNSGAPAISAQTYPIYQQNGYANPYANPTNDIASYLQGLTTQNQSPATNLSPSIIRQVLLNKILSNTAPTNFDPNYAGYGSGLNEYQNNQILPNLLNKYFAVPSQYLDSTNDVNKDDKINEKKTEEKPKKGKRRSSKSRKTHENKDSERKRNVKGKSDNENIESRTEISKTSKKKSRKQHTRQSELENETKAHENTHDTTTRRRKKKNKDREQSKANPEHEEHTVENTKPKKRRRHRKHKSDADNAEKVTEENVTLKQMKEDFNLANIIEGITEENRVPRNSKNDGNELIKAYSKMPDTIANNFLSKLPKFDNPLLANFFTDYENFYQTLLTNTVEKNEKKANKKEKRKTKRSKKIHKRRNGQKNRNSTQETSVIPNTKVTGVELRTDTVTTERTYIGEKIHTNVDPNRLEKSLKSIETETDENKMSNSRNENTPQDLDPNADYFYNGYIDDYYPLFTDNAAYNANNKEIYMKILGDNKYYYVTDRSEADVTRGQSDDYELPDRVIKDYEINKQYEALEKERISNEISEELQFRSPPVLEIPDFQTRQIEKSEIKPEPVYNRQGDSIHRYVGDKSISDEKSKLKKPEKPFVETTFARSKVVKYGAYSSEEKSSEGDIKPWADSYVKDGETTYIMAKSLDYPEVYW